jgi:hypothetical protein
VPVIYELRHYWIDPAVLPTYIDWVNQKAQPLQQSQFGFRVVGFWEVAGQDESGTVDPDPPNIIWMAAWESREERDRVWATLRASPEWAAIREGIPNFHRRPGQIKFLTGLDCSPLK